MIRSSPAAGAPPILRRTGPPGAAARLAAAVAALLAVLPALPAPAETQGVRGSLHSTARYFEFRPIQQDTVPRNRVTEDDGFFFFDGQRVTCRTDECVFFRPAPVANGVALTQDLQFTAWGFGVEGLSTTVLLRSRFEVGDDFVWPRSDNNFDAILAYAQLSREHFRVRAGRQRNTDGLGFTGYDGASAMVQPVRWIRVEGYGGRSLARGLHEPRDGVLEGLEDFVLDQDAWLIGGALELEPVAGTVLAGRYQRAIWADGSGLVSERASLDLRTDLLGPVRLDGSLDYDVAFDRVGKSHLRASVPIRPANMTVQANYRHYVPYFELRTIWGFFSPTGYDEGEIRLSWTPAGQLSLWGSAALRQYRETDTDILPPAEEDDTHRLGVGARWRPGGLASRWSVNARYVLEDGFGAFLSNADASVRWQATPELGIQARGTAFQQVEDFRVGEGVVVGGGMGIDLRLWEGIRLEGGMDVYHQTFENRPSAVDWNQIRAHSSLRIPVGGDPGLRDGEDR